MTTDQRPRTIVARGRNTSWGLVVLAAALEVAWAIALTSAEGLTRPAWAVAGLSLAVLSLVLLALALRNLPLASAYVVWIGIGAVGVALTGVLVLGDPLSPARAICLSLILAGVIGLTLSETPRGTSGSGAEAR